MLVAFPAPHIIKKGNQTLLAHYTFRSQPVNISTSTLHFVNGTILLATYYVYTKTKGMSRTTQEKYTAALKSCNGDATEEAIVRASYLSGLHYHYNQKPLSHKLTMEKEEMPTSSKPECFGFARERRVLINLCDEDSSSESEDEEEGDEKKIKPVDPRPPKLPCLLPAQKEEEVVKDASEAIDVEGGDKVRENWMDLVNGFRSLEVTEKRRSDPNGGKRPVEPAEVQSCYYVEIAAPSRGRAARRRLN